MKRNPAEPGTEWHRGPYSGAQKQPWTGGRERGCSRLLLAALLGLLRSQALRKDEKEKGKLVGREEVQEMGPGENSSSVPQQERSLYRRGRWTGNWDSPCGKRRVFQEGEWSLAGVVERQQGQGLEGSYWLGDKERVGEISAQQWRREEEARLSRLKKWISCEDKDKEIVGVPDLRTFVVKTRQVVTEE